MIFLLVLTAADDLPFEYGSKSQKCVGGFEIMKTIVHNLNKASTIWYSGDSIWISLYLQLHTSI